MSRSYTVLDRIITHLDRGMRTVLGGTPPPARPAPAPAEPEAPLSRGEARESAALMRVNHAGEVAAQALYDGQALVARAMVVRRALEQASSEENDHLHWCRERVEQLGGRTSALGPLWYAGSFGIGVLIGALGDRWNLGFLAETEHQVVAHLGEHLERLPAADHRSRAILEQMRSDEAAHATTAVRGGGGALPAPIKRLMRFSARIMTRTAYWI